MAQIRLHPLIIIDENILSWKFARSSGPGGQHVNKTDTKAILEWPYIDSGLPESVVQRLSAKINQSHRSSAGIVVSSDSYRSQRRNMDSCIQKLKNLIAIALKQTKKRKPTKPTRASKERRIAEKKRKSDRKAQRKVKFE